MNIPDKIKVGYKEYKLEEWKQTVASANEAQGQFFSKEGVIGYVTTEKGVSHANTILHEIMHAIIYQWNIELDEKVEELVVNGLSNGLTTVLVDNPKLMDYLKEKIKEGWMPQPIMKKYKHGEFGADYPKSANEKLDKSMMKTYS